MRNIFEFWRPLARLKNVFVFVDVTLIVRKKKNPNINPSLLNANQQPNTISCHAGILCCSF